MTTGIVLPAHMGSTRFPGKPLALVGGKPLLSYAVECAKGTGLPYTVATSDTDIIRWCLDYGAPVFITSHTGPIHNGTERAAVVNKTKKWDRVIVLQCDEPDLPSDYLKILANEESVTTIVCTSKDSDEDNPNTVFAEVHGELVRKFLRGTPIGYRHVGVYLYDASLLDDYLNYPPTPCESSQSLEQLRTMAMGYAWLAIEIERPLRSVNVPEDVNQFQADGTV